MPATAIDWDRIRDINDVITPHGYHTDRDTGQLVAGTARLFDFTSGTRGADRDGNKFRIMGAGAVQGTVILRDRHRRLFHADGDIILRPVR